MHKTTTLLKIWGVVAISAVLAAFETSRRGPGEYAQASPPMTNVLVKADTLNNFEVDTPASFPGGDKAFYEFMVENVQLGNTVVREKLSYKTYLLLTIDSAGRAVEPQMLRGINTAIDEKLLRVIGEMPLWLPATKNGAKIPVRIMVPLHIHLD